MADILVSRRAFNSTVRRSGALAAILVCFWSQVARAGDESTSADPRGTGTTQPTQAELDAQKRKLEKEADALDESRKNCEDLLDDINSKQADKPSEDRLLEIGTLKEKLAAAQTQYSAFVDPSKPPRDFGRALTELNEAFRTFRLRINSTSGLLNSLNLMLDDEQLKTVPRQLARNLTAKGQAAFATRPKLEKPLYDKLEQLVIELSALNQHPDPAHLKTGPQSLMPLFDEASKQVDALGEAVKKYYNEAAAAKAALFREYQTLVETEIKRLKDAAKANLDQQSQVLKQLGTLEHEQSNLDERLMYILLGMMGTVLLMLIIVRWKGDYVSELIVRERTAVEILSIGMFLSTIMFLSAARYIEKTILGTLLGTLAGYLFTRRSSANTAAEESRVAALAPPAVPGTPAKPSFDPTSRKMSLSSLPARADSLKAFCRNLTTSKNEELGTTATTEFVIPLGKLTAGQDYELWFVASNATGDSKPGPILKITAS